jgi:DNA-binding transcriptional regulator YiaG
MPAQDNEEEGVAHEQYSKRTEAEISRLARKEIKSENAQPRKQLAIQRGLIAGLRKKVDSLQKEVSSLKRAMPKADRVLEGKTEPEGRFWITGKGIRAMRKRTGLTQEKFGKLVGVSVPTVVNWEKAEGKLNLRKAAAGALQGLRGEKWRRCCPRKPTSPRRSPRGKPRRRPDQDFMAGIISRRA